MKLARSIRFVLCGLSVFAFAQETAQTASIFVQDPSIFHRRQEELQKLQAGLESSNEELDSLLASADRITKMHDQCASISLNDVLDDACWNFYKVELPSFEERYMKVTGEVRLGYMETARGLEDRKKQIEACSDALLSFANSKEEGLILDGGVFLEPLAQGFEANYNFTLMYEPNRRGHALEIAKKWGEACREMVIRQDGTGFAPYFLERLNLLNDGLREKGSLAVYKVDSSSVPSVYMDISQSIRSAYYLNGVKLFHSRIGSSALDKSNLRISFDKDSVVVDGASVVTKLNGEPVQYKGSVQFQEKAAKINGRWFWEHHGNTSGVDFGPEYDEDSLAVAKVIEEKAAEEAAEIQTANEAKETEKRRGIHPSLWAALTGVGVIYTDESAIAYGAEKKDLFIMPDISAAARLKINFGETADAFVVAGVGGMLGFAFENGLEQVYMAPLVQVELGYKNYGFRETVIIPITSGDEAQWIQFRSGGFYGFGLFNVEAGYTIVMNAGSGFYAGFGLTF